MNNLRDDYDQIFSAAVKEKSANLPEQLKLAQIRNANLGDENERLKLQNQYLMNQVKALKSQQPTQAMIEAGREYVWDQDRSAGIAFYPSMNSIAKIYRVMRGAV